jgi:hypothetical protein
MRSMRSVGGRSTSALLVMACLVAGAGCHRGHPTSRRDAAPPAAPAPVAEPSSDWYREMRRDHGDALSVGTVRVGAEIGF